MIPPDVQAARKQTNDMRAEFRVTLPHPVTASTGTRDRNTAAFVFEHAKCTNTTQFAEQLGGLLEATCSADALSFSPEPQVRLGLVSFAELSENQAGPPVRVPDAEKIKSAARFVPRELRVVRALNLTGDHGPSESGGTLTGELNLPKEFAPTRWAEPKLQEAVDAKGNDLKPKEDDDGPRYRGYSGGIADRFGGEDDEDEESAKPKEDKETHRAIHLSFRAPEWKVKEITRIKASIQLQYAGAGRVIKLTNAIPEKWITKRSSSLPSLQDFDLIREFAANPREDHRIRDERLDAASVNLQVQNVAFDSGMTTIILGVGAKNGGILEAQIFDAGGRAWFTQTRSNGSGDETMFTLSTVGQPKPPLSLALRISSDAKFVDIPIELQNVPLH